MTLAEELMRGPKLGESKKDIARRMYALGGWSQRALALYLSIPHPTIAKWLLGMKP